MLTKEEMPITRREYIAIHAWIRYKYGSANKCENDKCKHISKRFEWALRKSCEYKRDVKCFIQLCKTCHIEYDGQRPELLSSKRDKDCMDRINKAKFKTLYQYSREGVFLNKWQSITDAANSLGINRVCISTAITRNQAYKNYLWYFSPLPAPPKQ